MRSKYKIIVIIVCVILFGHLISMVADKGFRHYNRPYFDKMDSIFSGSGYNDIIFVGNSRTERGLNPYYIDNICKTKSYNIGWAGADINNTLLLFKAYLKSHPAPKIVVLGYDHSIFRLNDQVAAGSIFLHYLHGGIFKDIIERYGANYKLLKLFPDLKYSFFSDNDRVNILSGLLNRDISEEIGLNKPPPYQYDYRGFLNLRNTELIINKTNSPDTITGIRTESIRYINELINLSKHFGIELVFIYTPEYNPQHIDSSNYITREHLLIDSMMNDICRNNHIANQRFDTREFIREDFADTRHLNIRGAKKFSVIIGNYLKESRSGHQR